MLPPIIPESAPFSQSQRAWLSGFFAGALQAATPPDSALAAAPALPQIEAGDAVAAPETSSETAPVAEPKKSETAPPAGAMYNRLNPFPAPILEIRPLTRKDSQKDVRFVSFGLRGSGLQYQAGDALGVFPENDGELAAEIADELDATGEEPTKTPEGFVVPARLALEKGYVINRVSDEFLEKLSELAARDDDRERLLHLAQDDADDYLHGRDVLDILHDFPSARPRHARDVGALISSLDPLQPRLYSISSSSKAFPNEVHLTVGVVRYGRDGSERQRKGVASTFLSDRSAIGHKVGIFTHESHGFRPPTQSDAPMIMVGPGTGIAPFRAFLQERRELGHKGKNWLFFGDQRRESDFLFQTEIEEFVDSGHLNKFDAAFSRDQAEKIYVQHKMLENAPELWRWLEDGGHFYVCGDASRMAKDVDNALKRIVEEQGQMSSDAAKDYVANLSKTGRYGRDVY